jgi:CRISPR-associated endonuclease/helicase Cas3
MWAADRERSGWPSGGRHEAISVRISTDPVLADALEAAGILAGDRDLVMHLVASHHGNGRSGQFGVPDSTGDEFWVDLGGLGLDCEPRAIEGDLSRADWEQPARFALLNRRYGRRGLALIETVLRLADWEASRRIEPPRIEPTRTQSKGTENG